MSKLYMHQKWLLDVLKRGSGEGRESGEKGVKGKEMK